MRLNYCFTRECEGGIETVFPDGAVSYNIAPASVDFIGVAAQCGFRDPVTYVRNHDEAHAFLAEKMLDAPSPVLWNAAHGVDLDHGAALFEERWVYHWQRFVNGVAGPLEYNWPDWLYHWRSLCQR